MTVVGVGASAGGLAALKAFFAHVEPGSNLAFVVIVHLAPDHDSYLAELLQPSVRFPVVQVTEPVELEADRVYVIPPNCNLDSIDTHLRLSPLEDERTRRSPIDHFLRTLASTHDGNSVAVILSGTGSDGALGVKEIKASGGLTIAQDPVEAEYDGMPHSAIATGLIDLVLPVADIPEAVARFASTSPRITVPPDDVEPAPDEQQLLQAILAEVNGGTGRDFSRYKRSTVLRRIRRRMQILSLEDFAAYLARVHSDPLELTLLGDELLVNVSSFFRDPEAFDHLRSEVLPRIFDEAVDGEDIRVWSAGCATGEEAYSLAMMLVEEAERRDTPPTIQIFASDLHKPSLERAREGFYAGEIVTDVTPERLERFFTAQDGGYRVRKELRDLVVFAPHNLLLDPPFSRLELVLCRNVLIYLQRDVQEAVIALFHYALRSHGWLMLGSSETIDGSELFRPADGASNFHRKRNVPVPTRGLPVFPLTRTALPSSRRSQRVGSAGPVSYAELHHRLIGNIGPASMLIGPDDTVLHLNENAARYLVHPGGEITASVIKLVREELAPEIRAALQAARQSPTLWRSQTIEISGSDTDVRIEAEASTRPEEDGLVLVTLASVDREAKRDGGSLAAAHDDTGSPTQVAQAEAGRDLARQRLQAINEQYETSQEELQASNEELQSANEELRSSLEELETSREELQSMNEELQTVNQENRHKVEELAQLSGDLQNLLVATDISTLFLDRRLRIQRYTPGLADLFNIRSSDRGRPISDLTHRLAYDGLAADATSVLANLTPLERTVADDDGRHYLCRLLVYRSSDDRIGGVVITFIDITTQKAAEDNVRRSEEWVRQVMEAVPSVVFTTAADGTVDYISGQLESHFGVPARQVIGTLLWSSHVHPDDREIADEAWRKAVQSGERCEARYRIRCGDDSWRWVMVVVDPLPGTDDALHHWVGTITDVHPLSLAEHALSVANQALERSVIERSRQVRALAATLTEAEEAERRRVGEVLHDDLQQQLYSLQLLITFTHDDAVAERAADVERRLGEARDRLNEALETTRTLAIELSPPWQNGDSLGDALGWLKPQMRDLYGLEMELNEYVRVEAPAPVRTTVVRMVRELLFNVAKHAGVDQAVVEIDGDEDEDEVIVRVSDHGAGFDEAVLDDHGHTGLGLAGIRERVRLLGGSFELTATPGDGTQVVVALPVGAGSYTGDATNRLT